MNKIIDIQKNHSYCDYRRFFGYQYDKGKLLGFTIDQYEYMNPDRQYWEMKDENGVTKYFELPKYIKPFTYFSPYSFNRVRHSRPARNAIYILGGLVVASISCSFIAKKFFGSKNFDDIVVVPTELDKAAISYAKWAALNPGKDISKDKNLKVCDIANMAMGNFLYNAKYNLLTEEGSATLRDKALSVAHGHNDTNIIISHVLVDISNSFIQCDGEQLEESISYGTMSLTRFGKRDYYNEKGQEEVCAYHGTAESKDKVSWKDSLIKEYSKEDYMKVAGKNPAQPFLYNINKDTVLTDTVCDEDPDTGEKHYGNSSCTSVLDESGKIKEYKIELDLHNVLSVTRYVKRMNYLSGQKPNYFKTVHMSLVTDSNLVLKSSYVKEDYVITMMQSTGWLDTRYYVDYKCPEDLHISNKTESFDYSKFPF